VSAERRPFRHVYGPVPSRRLGRSLGIDLVPFKVCSYDCVYCQLGRTTTKTTERREWVPLAEVLPELRARLASAGPVDDVALAGSGEPTLHSALGEVIRAVRTMTSAPIAVLTNGSLLFREDVRRDLFAADVVLPSLDVGDEELFRIVNRPADGIAFEDMVEGLVTFTREFRGEVWLEVLPAPGEPEARDAGERSVGTSEVLDRLSAAGEVRTVVSAGRVFFVPAGAGDGRETPGERRSG